MGAALLCILICVTLAATDIMSQPMTEPVQPVAIEEVYQENFSEILNEGYIPKYDAEKLLNKLSDLFSKDYKRKEIYTQMSDRYIEMTGTIDKITYSHVDGCYIIFKQDRQEKFSDGWLVITCNFYNDKDKARVRNMRAGSKITVLGYCNDNFLLGPELVDCYIVD
jgi:hypothetical protein